MFAFCIKLPMQWMETIFRVGPGRKKFRSFSGRVRMLVERYDSIMKACSHCYNCLDSALELC